MTRGGREFIEGEERPDGAYPANRSPDDVEASVDTLTQELTTVCKRHDGDLSHAQIAQLLYDFADSYAEVYDIALRLEHVDKPNGDAAALIHYTGPRADDLLPSPIGRYSVEELRERSPDLAARYDTVGGGA